MPDKVIAVLMLLALAAPSLAQTRVQDHGPTFGGYYGQTVAGVGDVDADGSPDYAVGAPQAYNSNFGAQVGRVEVRSGANGSLIHDWEGTPGFLHLGTAVAGVGDVNGDGIPDIGVGADAQVQIRSGLDGSVIHDLQGTGLGQEIAAAGDVNGDGFDDVLLGLPYLNTTTITNAGGALLASGADGSYIGSWLGTVNFQRMGRSVASTPDALLIGSTAGNGPGVSAAGTVLVVNKAGLSTRFLLGGSVQGSNFGNSVDDAGDIDGDGVHDIVVGAHQESVVVALSYVGSVRVFSGATGGLLRQWFGHGQTASFGSTVRGLGDYDGDGTPDILAAAEFSDYGGISSGRVRVLSGDGGQDLVSQHGASNSGFSSDVAPLGDINQDGVPDWIVGVRQELTFIGPGSVQGHAYVYSGATLASASSSDLGGGCGLGAAPQLSLDAPPELSTTRQIRTMGFPANSSGVVYVHLAPPIQLPLAPGCILALDPVGFANWIPLPLQHDAMGEATLTVPLPTTPLLAGSVATLQASTPQPGAPLGLALSNGLRLDFGY